ncbi:MAG TPA: hypothetical protein VHB21_16625 [Minicystis sp.]|nr:hypothetical protein [Minicystis sp.]
MVRWVFASAFLLCFGGALAATAAGCGSGISDSQVQLFCDQEQASLMNCWDDTSRSSCESCYAECGSMCNAQAKCPERFSCTAGPQ